MPTVAAPAKLTLTLRITGVRPDGYHLIDAEMVTLDVGDLLDIEPGSTGFRVERNGKVVAGDPDDLVARALVATGREAGITLHKRVAAGAGLGGGSADAAAVLRWAGWGDPVAALALGADVPFCLVGGRARVQGVGEAIESLPYERREFTLLTPPVHCATPAVYAAWDAMGGPVGDNGNDLEPAALAAFPELARWRDELGDASGQRPRLAGSGSTWWVQGAHPGPGRVVTRTTPAES